MTSGVFRAASQDPNGELTANDQTLPSTTPH